MDEIIEYIHQTLGLSGGFGGRAALEAAVRRRAEMRDKGRLADYFRRLRKDEGEALRLAASLAGESREFIRHPWQFEGLAVLWADLASRREKRRLVIVCPGCGDGREAYALAMLARESGLMNKGWAVEVYAADPDARAVETARIGVYGPDRMEGLDSARRQRWFRPKGGRRQVREELREMVSWAVWPPGAGTEWPWPGLAGQVDVLAARGVMPQLTNQAELRLTELCTELCAAEGIMMTGPLETAAGAAAGFENERLGPVLYYRRRAARIRINPGHVSRKDRARREAAPPPPAPAEADPPVPPDVQAELRAAAGEMLRARATAWARLEEAARLAAARGEVSPEALGLAGRIYLELGRWADAAAQARRVMDLDVDRPWLRLLLAEAYAGLGWDEAAGEEAGAAAEMLRQSPDLARAPYFGLDPAWDGADPLETAAEWKPLSRRKK